MSGETEGEARRRAAREGGERKSERGRPEGTPARDVGVGGGQEKKERVKEGRKGFKGVVERDISTARGGEKVGEKSENRAKDRNRL